MIDHIGVTVADYARSVDFYRRALAPLGIELVSETHGWAGFGPAGRPQFWITAGRPMGPGFHVAFSSADRASVRRFHAAALAAGGRDSGPPGIREVYHPDYFGAFVLDPDGYNIEAVCHAPE
jgi:catechol 2,3-dioxygenase-like lactoylglutathione lyase family enzyme